jgi:hypothetical protein
MMDEYPEDFVYHTEAARELGITIAKMRDWARRGVFLTYRKTVAGRMIVARRELDQVKKRIEQGNRPAEMETARDETAKRKMERNRDSHFKKAYGIGINDIAAMRARQDDRCAICQKRTEKLVVDHDHATGKVRALLCGLCNFMIGAAKDSPTTLDRAALYVRRHAATMDNEGLPVEMLMIEDA